MRVVLDANIIVSGILSERGAAHALLDLVRTGAIDLVTSPVLLDEVEEVLERFLPREAAGEVRMALEEVGYLVRPSTVPAVTNDPDDDHVVAAGVAGRATYIVSRDTHLLTLGQHEGVVILDAAPALHRIRDDLAAS